MDNSYWRRILCSNQYQPDTNKNRKIKIRESTKLTTKLGRQSSSTAAFIKLPTITKTAKVETLIGNAIKNKRQETSSKAIKRSNKYFGLANNCLASFHVNGDFE